MLDRPLYKKDQRVRVISSGVEGVVACFGEVSRGWMYRVVFEPYDFRTSVYLYESELELVDAGQGSQDQ